MRLSRRGLILGGSAMLAGCATGQATPLITQAQAPVAPPLSVIPQAPAPVVVSMNAAPPLDPRGQVRKELMERAVAAMSGAAVSVGVFTVRPPSDGAPAR